MVEHGSIGRELERCLRQQRRTVHKQFSFNEGICQEHGTERDEMYYQQHVESFYGNISDFKNSK